jgi:hypothetical protein
MKTTQKDPRQFIPPQGRNDQAREHQILFHRTIDSDAKLIAAIEIHLLEGLEARTQRKLHDIIEHLRMLADGLPTAKIFPPITIGAIDLNRR